MPNYLNFLFNKDKLTHQVIEEQAEKAGKKGLDGLGNKYEAYLTGEGNPALSGGPSIKEKTKEFIAEKGVGFLSAGMKRGRDKTEGFEPKKFAAEFTNGAIGHHLDSMGGIAGWGARIMGPDRIRRQIPSALKDSTGDLAKHFRKETLPELLRDTKEHGLGKLLRGNVNKQSEAV